MSTAAGLIVEWEKNPDLNVRTSTALTTVQKLEHATTSVSAESQTATALSALVPALSAGLQQNVQSADGLSGLLGALSGGSHQRYLENPAVLGEAETVADGDGILGHIFGSKDVSRRVAAETAAQTGLGPEVMKRMLPLVATLVMGAMSRRASGNGASSLTTAADRGSLLEMLGGALDSNKDGSALDDITGMIGRTFGRS